MYSKINQKNRENQNIDPEVKEELEYDGRFSNISNESAGKYGDFLNPSNEANQPRRKRPVDLAMAEKDYSSDSEDEKDNSFINEGGNNIKNNIRDDESDSGDIELEDEASKLAMEAAEALKKRAEANKIGNDEESSPEIDELNTGFYGKLPGTREEKKEKPAKKAAKKTSKKSSKKSASKKAAEPEKEEDLTQIDESLEPVKELDIAVQKLPPRKKANWGKRFLSSLAYYSGKFFGKVIGTLGTMLNMITGGIFTKSNSWYGTWRRIFGQDFSQKEKNRKNIPGWDGAQFEERPENDDEVNIDFRRVPDVWSYPVAVEGDAEDKKDRKRKPRPPVISVYVAQSSSQYTVDEYLASGHTGIGIEYSRKSPRSGRWQRYHLRYGFGNGGGTAGSKSMVAVQGYSGATVPGELRNERGNSFDVSRSYTATPKQVNDVLRASETYADRGGYNQYTRNCTTFAKEMVVDVAKIRGAAPIFEMDKVYAHHKADRMMLGAGLFSSFAKAEAENQFAKLKDKDDMTYQGYGNKLASEEDYKRYNKSISFFSTHKDKAYSPNGAGENMLRMEGGRSGKLGAGLGRVVNGKEAGAYPIKDVVQQLPRVAGKLRAALESITPPEKLSDENTSDELEEILDSLSQENIKASMDGMPVTNNELLRAKQTDLIRYRSVFTDIVNDCNTLLFKYYHNDKRVQEAFLEILNWATNGIRNMDMAYAQTENKDHEDPEDDLKDLKEDFFEKEYSFTHTDEKRKFSRAKMTPSHFESYLQIYKTPEKAIKNYQKYIDLQTDYENGYFGENDPQFRELAKLDRIEALAEDFDKSHRYLLEKGKFSQQDVNYAFALSKKETSDKNVSYYGQQSAEDKSFSVPIKDFSIYSASNVYQMQIMKSVFGEMGSRVTQEFRNRGTSKEEVIAWTLEDMSAKIDENRDVMEMILRGIKNAIEEPNEKKVRWDAVGLLSRWVYQICKDRAKQRTVDAISRSVTDLRSPVMAKISSMIADIMSENQQAAE